MIATFNVATLLSDTDMHSIFFPQLPSHGAFPTKDVSGLHLADAPLYSHVDRAHDISEELPLERLYRRNHSEHSKYADKSTSRQVSYP